MKAYTDIEQSKKLAKILPIKSADMLFQLGEDKYADSIRVPLTKKHWEQMMPAITPCWSLAALLDVYPMCVGRDLGMFCCWVNQKSMCSSHFENPVDACVDMISLLKERSLI